MIRGNARKSQFASVPSDLTLNLEVEEININFAYLQVQKLYNSCCVENH